MGGFAGAPPTDLLTKWLEIAAFQPIDRDHSAKGTRLYEPWVDGPEHEAMRRRYIEERYRLLPYIYTVAKGTSRDGMPMMRPLFMELPHAAADGSPMDPGGAEFLLGPDLLIAPNPSPEEIAPYELHLSPGRWYDYWTGNRVGGEATAQAHDAELRDALLQNQRVLLKPDLATVPVYVRGGAILPLQNLVQSTEETPKGPLTLRVYVPAQNQSCESSTYADDGHTLNYRHGDYYRVKASCAVDANGTVTVTLNAPEGNYRPQWESLRVELVGAPHTPSEAIIDGASLPITTNDRLPGLTFERNSKLITIIFR